MARGTIPRGLLAVEGLSRGCDPPLPYAAFERECTARLGAGGRSPAWAKLPLALEEGYLGAPPRTGVHGSSSSRTTVVRVSWLAGSPVQQGHVYAPRTFAHMRRGEDHRVPTAGFAAAEGLKATVG